MNASQIYILLSIVLLALIYTAIFFVKRQKPEGKRTLLAALSFGFIIAGLLSSESRLIGYSLFGIGIVLAVIDIIKKSRS